LLTSTVADELCPARRIRSEFCEERKRIRSNQAPKYILKTESENCDRAGATLK
jgi:hypothetical protein